MSGSERLRCAAMLAQRYASDDLEVMNYDDEEDFVEDVGSGFWVEARVWVEVETVEGFLIDERARVARGFPPRNGK
jgi:hypothetical protein